MKKIFKQLIKLFPSCHIDVRHSLLYYKDGISKDGISKDAYEVYISSKVFTPSFKTLKELDEYLVGYIKDYKKVY